MAPVNKAQGVGVKSLRRFRGKSKNPLRKRLRDLGLRPKKRYGQHFLAARGVLERIVQEAELGPEDTVVEIGAGLGDLTEVIMAKAGRIVALEVDPQLFEGLQRRFHGVSHIQLIRADALHWPLPDSLRVYPTPRKILGNLPYNVGTQILLRFIRYPGEVDLMAMMFQREVAERLVAQVGTPAYGGITPMVQLNWQVRVAFWVPASAFHPIPMVQSAFVVLRSLPEPRVDVGHWGVFVKLVRAAFGQRRKTLRNALKGLNPKEPKWSESLLKQAGIQATRRGETLTLEEFARLSRLAQTTYQGE